MQISVLMPAMYDQAVDLWQEVGLTRPWNDPRHDLRRAMAGPASTVLALCDDAGLVGTAMVGHDGHRGWVYYLAVRPDARRSGAGRSLMAAAETWVQQRDVLKVQLMVRAGNPVALAFYRALGYLDSDVAVLGRSLG